MASTRTFNEVPLQVTTFDLAVAEFLDRAKAGPADAECYRLVNAYSIAFARRDETFQDVLCGRGVNLPDGLPLARWLKTRTDGEAAQVRGPSFFLAALDRGRERGVRHFFLGGSEELLERLVANVRDQFPGIEVAGVLSPPFRPITSEERAAQDAAVAAAAPDVVWVGLGTPKQDLEALRICSSLHVTTAGVGAAFDFAAGMKAEAPDWMRRLGLEWLFRLASEPRRLWRRYLFGNLRFLRLVIDERGNRSR